MAEKLLLIDGDLLLHRGCVAVEKDVRWDEDYHVLFSSFEEAWHNIVAGVERLMERFDTKRHLIALSGDENFRRKIDSSYKSNRSGSRKPLCFFRAKQQLREQYETYTHDALEADDVMGIFGSRHKDSIVCSMDKDLKTVPCTLYDGKDVKVITEPEADYWHLYQTLVGDTSDGYPGCPGIGPVKAEKILKERSTYCKCGNPNPGKCGADSCFFGYDDDPWENVVAAFEKAGLTEEDALRQARLARILRDSDWDSEKRQPILWTP
jgi:DNA polymerase-1